MVHKMGNRIQKFRKEQGMSQEEFGAVLNVSRQSVSKWENGDSLPDVYNLIAIARLFHISMDELVLGLTTMTSSVNIIRDVGLKRKQSLFYGRLCLLIASLLLSPPLILMGALDVQQPTLGIVVSILLTVFGILGFFAIHNFVQASQLKEELSYLESMRKMEQQEQP